ncbi:DUF4417 domain-containing protein [uncultured Succinivibrio sp.]|uniref:DUF4417 domain-containing protein n=1 Tax=uncultured Succinivibrio sp. TaxID=540749 RepID=UPI0025D5616F|nr:DUF4417 domain-containing protein [uncultured Succinivibrio sp.]
MTTKLNKKRKGYTDIFGADLLKNAIFTGESDIPLCKTFHSKLPQTLISYTDLNQIKGKAKADTFVHFFKDDQKFDGKRNGIMNDIDSISKTIHKIKEKGIKGIITPDFSTYQDFPYPIKLMNTFRMRTFGIVAQEQGLEVINNVRFGTYETYEYCFDGLPRNDVLCISTVGCLIKKNDRKRLKEGLVVLLKKLKPKILIIYGKAPYELFKPLFDAGIKIITFPSQASLVFNLKKKEKSDE